MGNYKPHSFITQPKSYPTCPIATPNCRLYCRFNNDNAVVIMQV